MGDTIRVSLSEEPEEEIPVARKIVAFVDECAAKREGSVITDDTLTLEFHEEDYEDLQLKAAMAAGALLIDRKAHNLVVLNNGVPQPLLADAILQAARIRFTKPEFISCPGCGRTLYDLRSTIAEIKEAILSEAEHDERFKTLKIGIMGCIVNGPGEMADADFGYVGAGPGRVSLYRGKECIEKNIPTANAVEKLIRLIKENI